ncbi:MAG: hypothetical protein AAF321_05535 [Pseudomonadota bacterium]
MRVLLHAPTADALDRARSNARNLLAEAPDASVEIVANAGGVAHALAAPDPTDEHLRLCAKTLARLGLDAGGQAIVAAAVLHLARRQAQGWAYIRA